MNVLFTGGGTLNPNSITIYGNDTWNLSGPGTLLKSATAGGNTVYLSSGTVNVSGGASLVIPTTDTRIGNVGGTPAFTANVNGGTISLVNLNMNPNNRTDTPTTLTANVSGGGLFSIGNGGLGLNTGGSALGVVKISTSSGSTFLASGGIGIGTDGTLNANLSGGTIQTSSNSITINNGSSSGGTGNITFNGGGLVAGGGLNVGNNGHAAVLNVNFSGGTIQESGGNSVYAQGGTVNFNVPAAGGTVAGNLNTNFAGAALNFSFSNGGTLNTTGYVNNLGPSSSYNVSGNGLLNDSGVLQTSGASLALSVSGGAALSAASASIYAPCVLNATINGGTLQIGSGGFAINPNSTSSGGTLTANISGGGLFSVGSGGIYTTNAASNVLSVSASGGSQFQVGSGGIGINGGTFNATLSGGTIQTTGSFTDSGTANISFGPGDLFQASTFSPGAASLLNLSGSGTLNVTTTGTLYLPSGGTFTANVSNGGALLVPNSTDIRVCNVASSTFTANVNGGTVSLNGLAMNPNGGTTYGGTLIANVSNGGLFNVNGGINLNTGGAANNGLLSLSVSSGSTFQVGGYGFGVGSGGALNANILSGGTVQTTILGGAGAVTVSGTGLFQVKGTGNGYSGNLALNGGALQFGTLTANAGSGFGGIGNITTAPGTTLLFSGTANGSDGITGFLGGYYGIQNLGIGGSGTVVLNNAGAALNSNVTLSPSFAGTLQVGANLSMILSSGSAYGNPALVQIPSSSMLRFAWWNGSFTGNPAISFPLQIAGTGVGGQGAIIPWGWAESLGNPTPSATNTCVFAGPITLTGNTLINASDLGIYFNISGVISGANSQLQVGPDTTWAHYLTLSPSAQNTFGSLNVNAGWDVVAQNGYAFSSGSLLINGGEIDTNGNNFSFTNLTGTGGNLVNGGATASTVAVGSDNSSTTFSGGINDYNASNIFASGSASLALVKTGTGTLTLNGANGRWSGGTQVNGGMLQLGNGYSLGTGSVGVAGGATLDLNGYGYYNEQFSKLSIAGSGLGGIGALINSNLSAIHANGTTAAYVTPTTTLTGNASIGGPGTLIMQGQVVDNSGGFALTKVGTGLVYLGTSNIYSGGNVVTAGTLQLGNASALGSTSGSLTVNGGVLDIDGYSPTVGAVTLASGSIINSGNSSHTLTGTSYEVQSGLVSVVLANYFATLTKDTTGTVSLTAANTYGGGTTFSAGTLQMGHANALGNNGSAPLNVAGGVLDLDGNNLSVDRLSGAGTIDTSAGASSLTVGGANGDSTFSGTIQNTAGAIALTKTGFGTLVLSGSNNTYSGGTDVEYGTLEANYSDSLPYGSSLTVGYQGTVVFAAPSGAGASMIATSSRVASPAGATAPVPEPGTLALLAAGLVVGFGVWRRRKAI